MLHDFGRGPFIYNQITITTANDEEFVDLPRGCRMVMIQATTANTAVKISNKKGEVGKTSGEFWTIQANSVFKLDGFRIMEADAMRDGKVIPNADVENGDVLEQRLYLSANTNNTVIEVLIIPAA